MHQAIPRRSRRCGVLVILLVVAAATGAFAQGGPEVYNATASLKTAVGASMNAPVVISISRWTSDADRGKAAEILKTGGTAALQKELASWPEAGVLQLGQIKAPIRFARTLPVGEGKVVTVITAEPVFFVGAGLPEPKPKQKAGYEVAVALFQVDAAGKGDVGDLAPAAKVKLDDKSGFVIEDYGAEAVRLEGITRK
jgi:hypothetical protein